MPDSSSVYAIGAGFGRTGTDSLRLALERLGFGPTMHMYKVMYVEPYRLTWLWLRVGRAVNQETRDKLLRNIMTGYHSSCDGPSFVYYLDMMRLYPEAKIILTVRDSAEQWYESASRTIFIHTQSERTGLTMDIGLSTGLYLYNNLHPYGYLFQMMLDATMSDITPHPANKADTIARYNKWIEDVKQNVTDKDNFLVLNPKDGWDPLCKVLNVSLCPAELGEPYPRLNSETSFSDILVAESRMGWFTLLVYLIAAFIIICFGKRRGKSVD